MTDNQTSWQKIAFRNVLVIAGCVILPFVPLIVAEGEFLILHTKHFADFINAIGMGEVLDRFYSFTGVYSLIRP